mmetsp:Transcript_27696/g.67377  ORF Transcript_27696/g.67377 Transcript_27696/m.67377 type:complete len:690 (-) Transcript_27696:631-2700(-)
MLQFALRRVRPARIRPTATAAAAATSSLHSASLGREGKGNGGATRDPYHLGGAGGDSDEDGINGDESIYSRKPREAVKEKPLRLDGLLTTERQANGLDAKGDGKRWRIRVKRFRNRSDFWVSLAPNAHVELLMEKIKTSQGIPIEIQKVIWRGKILRQGRLRDLGLSDGCAVHLLTTRSPGQNQNRGGRGSRGTNKRPRCQNGHDMTISDYSDGGYAAGWICDRCQRNGFGRRWVCIQCRCDFCHNCEGIGPDDGQVSSPTSAYVPRNTGQFLLPRHPNQTQATPPNPAPAQQQNSIHVQIPNGSANAIPANTNNRGAGAQRMPPLHLIPNNLPQAQRAYLESLMMGMMNPNRGNGNPTMQPSNGNTTANASGPRRPHRPNHQHHHPSQRLPHPRATRNGQQYHPQQRPHLRSQQRQINVTQHLVMQAQRNHSVTEDDLKTLSLFFARALRLDRKMQPVAANLNGTGQLLRELSVTLSGMNRRLEYVADSFAEEQKRVGRERKYNVVPEGKQLGTFLQILGAHMIRLGTLVKQGAPLPDGNMQHRRPDTSNRVVERQNPSQAGPNRPSSSSSSQESSTSRSSSTASSSISFLMAPISSVLRYFSGGQNESKDRNEQGEKDHGTEGRSGKHEGVGVTGPGTKPRKVNRQDGKIAHESKYSNPASNWNVDGKESKHTSPIPADWSAMLHQQ